MKNKLKIYRTIKGLRQLDLARLMGENYSEIVISRIETERQEPTNEEIVKLAEFLNVKPTELFPELFSYENLS